MANCAICGEDSDYVTKCMVCGEKFCAPCGDPDKKLCLYCGDDDLDFQPGWVDDWIISSRQESNLAKR